MLTHSFNYESTLADAIKVNWRVEDLIGGDKHLDFSKPLLPETLAGVSSIKCLNAREKMLLNQIRGNTYFYFFQLSEEFILPFVLQQVSETVFGGDTYEMRALATFADEEAKHIHLFRRFAEDFERGFGTKCAVIGPGKDIVADILNHGPLGIGLMILHLEWMTHSHYIDSVKDNDAAGLDPQFSSMLRHHWMEESQHAKLDTMLVDKFAREAGKAGKAAIAKGFDDYAAIVKIVDNGIADQLGHDIDALSRAAGRKFSSAEKDEILTAQRRSYRWAFLVSGMVHPNFVRFVGEISKEGLARVDEMKKALS